MMAAQVDRRINVPTNKVTFFEIIGLLFDTSMIFEDELEVGPRTPLNKIDKYFYKTSSSLLRNNDRPCIPFK